MERVAPSAAEKVMGLLEPGSTLLARWLPVFFVPTLVILPLSPAPSKANTLRLIVLVCGGWFVSLASTAAVIVALSSRPGARTDGDSVPTVPSSKPPPAFGTPLIRRLGLGAAAAGATAALSSMAPPKLGWFAAEGITTLAKVASLLMATLFGFSAGTRLPRRVTKVVHPVVTCTATAMASAAVIGRACGLAFRDVLRSYVTKSR